MTLVFDLHVVVTDLTFALPISFTLMMTAYYVQKHKIGIKNVQKIKLLSAENDRR